MSAHRPRSPFLGPFPLLAALLMLLSACGGGGGGAGLSVDVQAIGELTTSRKDYEFSVQASSPSAALSYSLNGAAEVQFFSQTLTLKDLQDDRYALVVIAREGGATARDEQHWTVDNDPPAPPLISATSVTAVNGTQDRVDVVWDPPLDGTANKYELYYIRGWAKTIATMTGRDAIEGASPIVVAAPDADGRFRQSLTGFVRTQMDAAFVAIDAQGRRTEGPIFRVEDGFGTSRSAGDGVAEPRDQPALAEVLRGVPLVDDFDGNGLFDFVGICPMISAKVNDQVRLTSQVASLTSTITASTKASYLYNHRLLNPRKVDMDLDGLPDIIGTSSANTSLSTYDGIVIMLSKGTGYFSSQAAPFPKDAIDGQPLNCQAGDFDGDGIPDVALVMAGSGKTGVDHELWMLFGQGTTIEPTLTFDAVKVGGWTATDYLSVEVMAGDADGDGRDELYMQYREVEDKPMIGRFGVDADRAPAVKTPLFALDRFIQEEATALVDLDGDGQLELAFATWDKTTGMYLVECVEADGSGRRKLSESTYQIMGLGFADCTADGLPDMILQEYYSSTYERFTWLPALTDPATGRPTGSFGTPVYSYGTLSGYTPQPGFATADLEHDGSTEVFSFHYSSSAGYRLAIRLGSASPQPRFFDNFIPGSGRRTSARPTGASLAGTGIGGASDLVLAGGPGGVVGMQGSLIGGLEDRGLRGRVPARDPVAARGLRRRPGLGQGHRP
ncbi:MAG: FG-GAP-like repeat-containing protein [Planctomycetota bacterium]